MYKAYNFIFNVYVDLGHFVTKRCACAWVRIPFCQKITEVEKKWRMSVKFERVCLFERTYRVAYSTRVGILLLSLPVDAQEGSDKISCNSLDGPIDQWYSFHWYFAFLNLNNLRWQMLRGWQNRRTLLCFSGQKNSETTLLLFAAYQDDRLTRN